MGECKKKLDTELSTYFPGWFGADLEYADNLRRWYLAQIEDDEKALKETGDYLLSKSSPKCFNPYADENILVAEEKEFEDICNSMEDNGVSDVRSSTVFEFYSKVQYLEKKIQKIKQHPRG